MACCWKKDMWNTGAGADMQLRRCCCLVCALLCVLLATAVLPQLQASKET